MLKNVEMGASFYKELGKLEKQLAKYQIDILPIAKARGFQLKHEENWDQANSAYQVGLTNSTPRIDAPTL